MRKLKYLILFLLNILCLNLNVLQLDILLGNIENGGTYF